MWRSGRARRVFWVTFACVWGAMLALAAATQRSDGRSAFAEHPLTIPAWGVLVTILGVGVLVDRRRMFRAYAQGMPGRMSETAIQRIVVVSGLMLTTIGVLVIIVGVVSLLRGSFP
jgi:hypothetical protein